MKTQNRLMAFGLASALAIGTAVSASAGPLPTGIATVKSATSDHVTDIRWRGHGYGPGIGLGIGAGIAAGALIGSAVAARPYGYGYGYYDAPVYAEPPAYVYDQPYAYEPVYPAPGYYGGYGYRRGGCTTDEGYGRRRPCSGN